MAVTIIVHSAEMDPRPSITFDSPRVVIGRGEGSDVRLPDPSVSHRHATLRQRGSDYLIVDEGSTNGTWVGTVRLASQSPRVIKSGERVRVGRVELEVVVDHRAAATATPKATRELALELVSAALAAQGERLTVVVEATPTSGGKPKKLRLEELGREYVVGRSPKCDLPLEDSDCSRRHVGITRQGDALRVRDLGSKNGTKLGSRVLAPEKKVAWLPDSEVRLGATRLTYVDPLGDALEDLENAADEPLSDAEPTKGPAPKPPDDGDASEPERASKPHLRQERRTRRTLDPRVGDALVAVVGFAVLAMSLLGLYWLLGAQ